MDTPDPTPGAWPPLTLLTGHLAPASLVKYAQAVAAYRAWCGSDALALAAASLARWRTHLVHDTRLHPHTINHRLAAVKRLIAEAAAQGDVDVATMARTRRTPAPRYPGKHSAQKCAFLCAIGDDIDHARERSPQP